MIFGRDRSFLAVRTLYTVELRTLKHVGLPACAGPKPPSPSSAQRLAQTCALLGVSDLADAMSGHGRAATTQVRPAGATRQVFNFRA
jgi:hypothetical protein